MNIKKRRKERKNKEKQTSNLLKFTLIIYIMSKLH